MRSEDCRCRRVPSGEQGSMPAALLMCHDEVEVFLLDGAVTRGQLLSVIDWEFGEPPTSSCFLWLDDKHLIDLKEVAAVEAVAMPQALHFIEGWVVSLRSPDWARRSGRWGVRRVSARVPVSDHEYVEVTVEQRTIKCMPSF